MTLENILSTQDLGSNSITKVCEQVLNSQEDEITDPITKIIVNAFNNSEFGTNTEQIIDDLNYAINQLQRAKNYINYNHK